MCAESPESFAPDAHPDSHREVDWLLTNVDWVVTGDEGQPDPCFRLGALAVDGDTLVGIGPVEWVESSFVGRRKMDLSGCLVLPGLVNTHTHAAMSCFRGLGNDLPLQRWLTEVIFPAESAHVNPELVYWGTLLAAVEMLKCGVTTFCDGYFFEGAAAQAALDSGIRAVLGQGILDFPSPDQPEPGRSRETAEAFLNDFPYHAGRLRPSLFCHAPYTCGPETLKWVKALCRQKEILFQIHLSETSSEVEQLVQEHGRRPTHYLDSLGILDSMTLCAHGVWLDNEEMEILAKCRATISHTAESNMKLASGVAPVPDLLSAGVLVGLGTDGCASNNDLDLFSEMDKVAKLHKVFGQDPTLCSAPQVFRMATMGGATSLSWESDIGSLEIGKKADLVAIDIRQPHLTPLYDPISHLVYVARGSDTRHVWVDGRLVVTDGRVVTVDETEAMRRVTAIARKVQAPGMG